MWNPMPRARRAGGGVAAFEALDGAFLDRGWSAIRGLSWKSLTWPAVGVAAGTALGVVAFGLPALAAAGLATAGVVATVAVSHLVFERAPHPAALVVGGALGVVGGGAGLMVGGEALGALSVPTTVVGSVLEATAFGAAGAAGAGIGGGAGSFAVEGIREVREHEDRRDRRGRRDDVLAPVREPASHAEEPQERVVPARLETPEARAFFSNRPMESAGEAEGWTAKDEAGEPAETEATEHDHELPCWHPPARADDHAPPSLEEARRGLSQRLMPD
jgi:hypothetical protein